MDCCSLLIWLHSLATRIATTGWFFVRRLHSYGRTAIGILIVQDIAAVVFLAASMAKLPSPWAVAIIIGLIAAKPLLIMLLKRAGHGELLILYGLVLAIGGSTLFEMVSLKGDLGLLNPVKH